MEEIEWRQKSKALWLKAGDNNTRFFHTIASQHKRSNCINSMHIEGVLHHGQQAIASQLVEHFSRAFRRPRRWFPKWKDETLPQLSRDQLNGLARPFHEEDIQRAVFSAEGDKAPGPDGFTFRFFQAFWPLIKEDILAVFTELQSGRSGVGRLNTSLFTLIPK
ncbi:hypothetical protein QJS10_CPB21g01069 [Acorus calamus]|uniref:Reverse transcriptase n=1 Tax=Acorus calamus TaxID=4465 RepID=A0AAV9C2R3_ACOCL|nr:hypothetical protein QJS10_CPB21g01069 [Acorus calamus]